MKRNLMRLGVQYFADGENVAPSVEQTDTSPTQTDTATAKEINYADLLKTDKGFQGFVDAIVTKSNQTAIQNALQKQQRLADDKLSESERLQVMSSDEKAKYFESKYKQAELLRTRDKEIGGLKTQTVAMLSESGIPEVFLSVFDFDNATAEDIKQRVSMLSEYEYYPKGELEKRIQSAVEEKLKQPPLTTQGDAVSPKTMPTFF